MFRSEEIFERMSEIRASIETANADQLKLYEEEFNSCIKELNDMETRETLRKQQLEELEAIFELELSEGKPIVSENMTSELNTRKDNKMTKEFRNYLFSGEMSAELRGNTLANSGAVLPKSIYDKMFVEDEKDNADILNQITVSNFQHVGTLSIPVASASTADWHTELDDITTDTANIESIALSGHELVKIVSISAAASSMTDEAFEKYLAELLNTEMGCTIEAAVINGTGSGQPTGILPGITWVKNTNHIESTADITFDDIISGIALLPSKYKKNAVLIGNRDMIYNKIRKIKDNDGRYIMSIDGSEATVLGVPVAVAEDMPNDTIIIGDLAKYYLNFSQPITLEVSNQSGFRKACIDIRALAVVDGKPYAKAFVKVSKKA